MSEFKAGDAVILTEYGAEQCRNMWEWDDERDEPTSCQERFDCPIFRHGTEEPIQVAEVIINLEGTDTIRFFSVDSPGEFISCQIPIDEIELFERRRRVWRKL